MRSWLPFFLAGLLASCAPVSPQKEASPLMAEPVQRVAIGGVLAADAVLDGDYLLEADLQVPAGITLTIQPGSSILVVTSDSTKIDPEYLSKETEILIRGTLIALGTATAPIRIYAESTARDQVLWAGLQFVGSRGSQLKHLQVEQAEAGVLCLDSSPRLDSVRILRSRYGILLQQGSRPQISDSLLADGEAGLFCWDNSAPLLERSFVQGHGEEGVYLGRECRATLRENIIRNNDRGVVLPVGLLIEPSNLIFENRVDLQRYPQEAVE